MNFDPTLYRYPSRRNVLYAEKGMVATGSPLAAQAGAAILRAGGNAVDAAVAAAACLTVVEPTSNGVGGDAFALLWVKGKLHGLNASGPAPIKINAQALRDKGHTVVPKYGWEPVTVPGAPSAWAELSASFGRLPLERVLQPAVDYARYGYPVGVNVGKLWKQSYGIYREAIGEELSNNWYEMFSVCGRCPVIGEKWRCEALAQTLEEIAATYAESFYRGALAERIAAFSEQTGGYLSLDDLALYRPEWVEPISVNYRGYDVYEIPPNGHGVSALMALNIIRGFDFRERETAETYHRQIEAMKLAFTDAKKYVADPRSMRITAADLLSDAYAEERRRSIGKEAMVPAAGQPQGSGTVYIAAADGDGNMVSYIQSNYMGFGSGLVVPDTGISLHNRGNNFELGEGHDNVIAPGKKPYHTIIPGFLAKDGKAVGPFGVMGGFMQPQGHVQVVSNTVDFNMNPQECLDAPRWQWLGGRRIEVEPGVPGHIIQELARRGHEVSICVDSGHMGRGEIIWRAQNGVLCGGTEPRTDGTVAVC